MTVIKTASPPSGEPVGPGDSHTWTVTVVNLGDQELTAIEVIDVVPAHVTVTDSAGAGVSGSRLSWLVDLPADSRAVLRYSGTVSGSAPDGAVLANTALAPLSGQSDTTSHPVAAAPAAPVAGPVVQPPAAPRPIGPLPLTGADLIAAVVVAAGGLAGGSALVLVARRRRVPSAGDPQAA